VDTRWLQMGLRNPTFIGVFNPSDPGGWAPQGGFGQAAPQSGYTKWLHKS